MNIAANPDLLPDGEAQVITNVEVTAQGALRSRQGSTVIGNVGAAVLQILPANGHRYTVSSGVLQRDFASAGIPAVPNGIASFQGYLWDITAAMKDNGTVAWNWLPAPPTTAVTGVASNVNGQVFASGADAWSVNPLEVGTGPFGSSFQIQTIDDSTYTATDVHAFDLSSFHVYDKTRWQFWGSQFKHLGGQGNSGVTVQIDCSDGSFSKDYFTCELPTASFKGAGVREWITVAVLLNANPDTPNAAFFTRVGNDATKGYNTCAAVRILIDSNTSCKFRIGTIDAIGGQAKALMDDKANQYYATFVTKDGHESNPGPVSAFISAEKQAINISNIPVSTDPSVIAGGGVYLYRKDSTLGATYRVTSTFLPNGTTTFHDDNGDDVITALGVQMVTDNNNPPAAVGLAGPFIGRLLAWGGTKASRLYWTKQLQPFAFSAPDALNGAWADVGDDGDAIVAITIRNESAFIYKGFTIYYLSGDPGTLGAASIQNTDVQMGACGSNAVCKGTNVDYFVSQAGQGVYQFNGDTATKISAAIDPIFHGTGARLPSGFSIPPIQSWNTIAVGFTGSTLRVAYDATSLVWNATTGAWIFDSRAFTSFYADLAMLGGQPNGNVVQLDSGGTDAGQLIPVVYEKSYDAHLPDTQKTWNDLTIQSSGGCSATVYYGSLYSTVGSVGPMTFGGGRVVIPLSDNPLAPVRSELLTVRLTANVSSEIDISGIWLSWYEHARDGVTFDLSTQDLGTDMLKRCREAIVELESFDTSVQISLLTDQPGGGMAVRQTLSMPAGSRRLEHVVFGEDYVGYLIRFFMFGENFNIYSVRASVQPIGTFLLGSRNEFWSSDPLDDDVQNVKMFKWLEVDFAADSGAILTFETDLPGGALAIRSTFTLYSTNANPFTMNDEETVRLRLPETVKGRLYRVRVTPVGNCRLEAIRVYSKVMGLPSASQWRWVPLPIRPTQDAVWMPAARPVDVTA